jgi:hypothetical protein
MANDEKSLLQYGHRVLDAIRERLSEATVKYQISELRPETALDLTQQGNDNGGELLSADPLMLVKSCPFLSQYDQPQRIFG